MVHRLTQRLRELRQEKNWRQKDVADKLGITESAYGYYEQGRREPSVTVLERLSQIYGVSVDYLLGLTDDPTPLEKKTFATELTTNFPDLTPEEAELMVRLVRELRWRDYLEAPQEVKNRFVEAVKLLLKGMREETQAPKEGPEKRG